MATLHAEPNSGLRHAHRAVTTLPLDPDGRPTRVRAGSVSFHLIRREGDLALRVRDSESPARTAFHGIDHYPVRRAWCVEARFEPAGTHREVVVPAVAGPGERYLVAGRALFEPPGSKERHALTAFDEDAESDLFFVFADATSGTETYGGGRFMYMPRPDADGRMALDFNRAYNPPCVFTPYATCPLPPPENRLPFRVEAGELAYTPDSTGGENAPNPSG